MSAWLIKFIAPCRFNKMIEEKQIEFSKKKHCYREVKRAQWNNCVRVNILTITRKHKRPKNDIVIYPTIYRLMT